MTKSFCISLRKIKVHISFFFCILSGLLFAGSAYLFSSCFSILRYTCVDFIAGVFALATKIKSYLFCVFSRSRGSIRRNASLMTLLARLRFTALPTFLPVTIPMRFTRLLLSLAYHTNASVTILSPFLNRNLNSLSFFMQTYFFAYSFIDRISSLSAFCPLHVFLREPYVRFL